MNHRTLLSLLVGPCVALASTAVASTAAAAEEKPAVPNATSTTAQPIGVTTRTPVDQLPSIKELPDPFLFVDGTRVKSKADWPRRQAELKELIQTYEYGHLPPVPPAGAVTVKPTPDYVSPPRAGSNKDEKPTPYVMPDGAREERMLLTVAGPGGKAVEFHVVLTLPKGDGPFPVVVRGDLGWGHIKAEAAAEIVKRGYVLADFDRTEIVPDKKGERDVGAYLVYPGGDFSATAAWAWGYHRVIDYLVTRPDVAKDKIAVTGHSRGGKTAIVAGLFDDRVALTVPNNSGCGGAGCYRHQAAKSEAIENILKSFPYWFQPDFAAFIGKVDRLPIDQHSVKAAIAPRALLTAEALGDLWANPEGTQVTHAAAKEVYDWLGAGDRIAIHYREGKHEQNPDDWHTLLDYADQIFFGKKGDTTFNELKFPDAPKIWSWAAPK